jgi:hypothetical protein
MRAFCDIAGVTADPEIQRRLRERGQRLFAGCRDRLHEDDLARLHDRLVLLETSLAAAPA